jgi:hypothetical protein
MDRILASPGILFLADNSWSILSERHEFTLLVRATGVNRVNPLYSKPEARISSLSEKKGKMYDRGASLENLSMHD